MSRGALIVGIDHYHFGALKGCIRDAQNVSDILKRHEFGEKNFDVETILSSESSSVSRTLLRRKISALFDQANDVALLYFSGHGTENNLGGYIVTQDAQQYDEGISVNDILQLANKSRTKERIIILDCCHSGHMGNLPAVNNTAFIAEGVSILTASKSNEKAYEIDGNGVFTTLLLNALQGGAADVLGKVSIASIYAYVDQALGYFDQRPLFKSHVSALVAVRRCTPVIDLSILRELPLLFAVENALYKLNPSYEPSHRTAVKDKCVTFSKLQKLRAARLVEPVGEEHLYNAAINSKSCRLTREGRYFWHLAKLERI